MRHKLPRVSVEVVDGCVVVRGEYDIANAEDLAGWLMAFDRIPFDLDLSGVTFFDCCALRALLRVARSNPTMRIVQSSPAVDRVLAITGAAASLTATTTVRGRYPRPDRPWRGRALIG